MEVFSYLFKNGVIKEETAGNCSIKGHSGCLNVMKKYPCGCVEHLKHHFIYACIHCGSNAKSLIIQKSRKLCPAHKAPRKQSESHIEHRIDALRRFYAKD